jgi:hypothetical protein
VKSVKRACFPALGWQRLQRPLPWKRAKPRSSCSVIIAWPARHASNFEVKAFTSGESSYAAIARAMRSYSAFTRARSVIESGTAPLSLSHS